MDQEVTGRRSSRNTWLRIGLGLIAAGLVTAMIVTGLGVASGQSDSSDDGPKAMAGKRFGHGGIGFGAIHGEFTTEKQGGGYQKMATQRGEVTQVSSSQITLKSEDDFSRSYTVDDNTLVNAGRDGIGDVKVGDQVHLIAIVEGSKTTAVQIMDKTRVRELRERWMPERRQKLSPRTSSPNA